MKWAVVIRHTPRPGLDARSHVTGRTQRLFFGWWQLRSLWRCRQSARALYGAHRVSIERW